MSGKGDTQRPREVDEDEFEANWQRTFGPKPTEES